MDSPYRFLFSALLGIGAIGFFSVVWVVPPNYAFIPRRLALAMRALSCAIGCGYLVLAYLVLQGAGSTGALVIVLVSCSTLNLVVLAVERPWSRRGPSTTPRT
jgi:hypothetical protein